MIQNETHAFSRTDSRTARVRRTCVAVVAVSLLTLSLTAHAGPSPRPPISKAFGQTVAQWQATWLSWAVGAITPPTDLYGNALVNGVALLPVPNATGDGTPASIDISLPDGEPFVVPLILVVSSSTKVSPDDFKNMSLTLTLDGVVILDSVSAFQYYSETFFNPPLAGGTVWLQGITITHTPLIPGQHVLQLNESITLPELGSTRQFNNTLNIKVYPTE